MLTRRQLAGETGDLASLVPQNSPSVEVTPEARATALRDHAWRALKKVCVLPSSGQVLAEAYGTADTRDALATSLMRLAALLEERRNDAAPAQLALYDRIQLTGALLDDMRAAARALAS